MKSSEQKYIYFFTIIKFKINFECFRFFLIGKFPQFWRLTPNISEFLQTYTNNNYIVYLFGSPLYPKNLNHYRPRMSIFCSKSFINVVSEKCSNSRGRQFVKIQWLNWLPFVKRLKTKSVTAFWKLPINFSF